MKFCQRLLALLMIAVALLSLPVSAAEPNAITVQHVRDGLPVAGAQFQLYQVSSGNKTAQDAYAEVLRSQKTPLAMSGFVLLLVGWLRRKESRNET